MTKSIKSKQLRHSVSLTALALAGALSAPSLILATAPALAAGGEGGGADYWLAPNEAHAPGGVGGVDAGENGGDGSSTSGIIVNLISGGGGGGGGGAANGGNGATNGRGDPGGAGGAAGATPGADGENGEAMSGGVGGGGGGGGAHGTHGAAIEILDGTTVAGGAGGTGGAIVGGGGGGAGGGGSGGYGAHIDGGGEGTNAGTAQGGNGGVGGEVLTAPYGNGGNGGDGGAGIGLSDGASVVNQGTGTAIGGGGGAGGTAIAAMGGSGGNGGAGILGGDGVVIINQDTATVLGGAGNTGSEPANFRPVLNGRGGYGIFVGAGAHITNRDNGSITGGDGASKAGSDFVGGSGGAGIGTGNAVIIINQDAATITGGSGAAAGTNNGAGEGGAGVIASGLLDNSGTISGGTGGAGDNAAAGTGGVGVSGSALTILNGGAIAGGNGGAPGFLGLNAAGGGAGVDGANLAIINTGTISGGDGGGGFPMAPDGGVGISGSDLSVVNAGTISGGGGGLAGIPSAAIDFTGGVNRLELRTGYVFNGAILANGVLDTLALGGTTDDTFDVTQILTGQTFQDFEQLEKVGANTWTLTGDGSGFGGQTNVVEGTLLVNGSLGGTLDVLDGGILGGSGTLGAGAGSLVTIANGGTLAPGNSIGTIVVDGDLVFDAGSIFEAEIDPALAADLVDVSGTVTINGGTVHALKAGGVYTPDSRWTIINAAGGVTGTFDALSQNMPFVNLALAYDANAVFIDATRNTTSFCDVAATANQCETGNGLESSGPGNPVYDAVAALPDEDSARAALDGLSGEIHASAQTALIEDSRFVREAINDRLRSAFGQPGAPYAPVLAYAPNGTPMAVASDHAGPVVWGHGFGSWSSTDSDGNAAGFDRSIGGLLIGTDGLVGDWRIGLLAGYSRSGFNVDDRASSGTSDNYHVGLYGGTEWGDIAFRTGAAYTWHNLETRRTVAMPGFSDALDAAYSAGTFQAFGELAYGFELGNGTRFEPFANLAHVSLHTGSFSETGAAAALSGPGSNADVTFTTLGLRAEHTLALGTVDATLRGMVGWKHAFGEVTPDSTHAFASGNAFTIAGAPIAKDTAVIEAGLDLNFTPETTFGLSYSGQIAGSAQDHGFKANLTVKF